MNQAPVRQQEIRSAAALIIGDEVLSGKTMDRNSHWLAGQLYAMGIPLKRVLVVPDEIDVIAEALHELAKNFDLVVTSGGIGPTHDDKTYVAVAKAFDRPVIREERLVARMRKYYGDKLNEARLKMADIPSPDELCFESEMVTVVVRVANVYILPGIPSLFASLFTQLQPRFSQRPRFLGMLRTQQREGELADLMTAVDENFVDVQIGSYPRLGEHRFRVQIVVEGLDLASTEAAYQAILKELAPDQVGDCDPVHRVVSAASLHAPDDDTRA